MNRPLFQPTTGHRPPTTAQTTAFAPGRVNLIGEHTDYNDGFVLPVALDCGTFTRGSARADRRVRVSSRNFEEVAEFDLDGETEPRRGIWLDYLEGITRVLQEQGVEFTGADLEMESTVPIGGGLSSSTAFELSYAIAMLRLCGQTLDRRALALASQRANHLYVGTRGGLMDQLTILFGRRGHALLIDCRSLEIREIRLDTSEVAIVICDTNVKHNLVASEYNARRAECEYGVEVLNEYLPGIVALRDVEPEEFAQYEGLLPDAVRRRCRHVISENRRTLAAAEALNRGDFAAVGALMAASHNSLRDDYEVSCMELDVAVEIAGTVEGVVGARMTGGGFGGCTVNLVRRDALASFHETLGREYRRETGIAPSLYIADASDGARELSETTNEER